MTLGLTMLVGRLAPIMLKTRWDLHDLRWRPRAVILDLGEPGSLVGAASTRIRQDMSISLRQFAVESDWRNETLRTNLWLIPAAESVAAVLLYVLTLSVDRAAFRRRRAACPRS